MINQTLIKVLKNSSEYGSFNEADFADILLEIIKLHDNDNPNETIKIIEKGLAHLVNMP